MDTKFFFDALPTIASSPYALIGYAFVIFAIGATKWQSHKLNIISNRLKDLPEKDRLKALELEYKLIPKGGLDANSFLAFKAKQGKYIVILAVVAAIVLISSLATYKAIEEKKLSSLIQSTIAALNITKLGKISIDNNNFSIAAGNLEATLEVYPTQQGYMNLGYIYEEISNTDAAILAYQRALEFSPENPEIHNSLGSLYKDAGKFDLAVGHLDKAISLSKIGDEVWFMATVNRGSVLYEIGRKSNDVAIRQEQCKLAINQFFLKALEVRGGIKNQDIVAKTLANTGNCYKDIQDFKKAEELIQEAVLIKRRESADRSLADTLVNLADAFLKQEQYSQAKPYLLEAASIFDITGNQLGLGTAYFNLGDICWADGDPNEAKNFYQKSVDLFTIARLGGEYEQAPKRRMERMRNNDLPEFVKKASQHKVKSS